MIGGKPLLIDSHSPVDASWESQQTSRLQSHGSADGPELVSDLLLDWFKQDLSYSINSWVRC